MPGKKTLEHHESLMTAMAAAMGLDLAEAELRGDLPPEMREDMVLSCTGCTSPGACQKWLSTTQQADAPPAYCRNADALVAMVAE